ncbi:MAG: hypothetical protein NVSMB22_09890 [Chloroflexota bacterium]
MTTGLRIPPNAAPALDFPASAESLAQSRSSYTRLLQRYVELTWASSAVEQRERAGYQHELLSLYLALHPDSPYSWLDDFDTVLRASRRG